MSKAFVNFRAMLKTKNTKQFMFVKWTSEVGDASFILEGDVHWQLPQHASIAEEICNGVMIQQRVRVIKCQTRINFVATCVKRW